MLQQWRVEPCNLSVNITSSWDHHSAVCVVVVSFFSISVDSLVSLIYYRHYCQRREPPRPYVVVVVGMSVAWFSTVVTISTSPFSGTWTAVRARGTVQYLQRERKRKRKRELERASGLIPLVPLWLLQVSLLHLTHLWGVGNLLVADDRSSSRDCIFSCSTFSALIMAALGSTKIT